MGSSDGIFIFFVFYWNLLETGGIVMLIVLK